MQQFRYDSQGSDIRLSEEEARALAALHAKRRELRDRPTLKDLADQLGVSESEAMAMLTEIRTQSPVTPTTVCPTVVTREHRGLSSSAWALVSLAAAVIVVVMGLFAFRAYVGANEGEAATASTIAPPMSTGAPMNIPPTPTVAIPPDPEPPSEIIINDQGIRIKTSELKRKIQDEIKAKQEADAAKVESTAPDATRSTGN